MKWIVLAIAVFIAGYTLVNLYYRKPGRAFRPYEDMNKRATTARLLAAGWQKLPVELQRPADRPLPGLAAPVVAGAPGLGTELDAALADRPVLLGEVTRVHASLSTGAGRPYSLRFTGILRDQHLQVARVEAFFRGDEIVFVPALECLPGDELLSRWNDAEYRADLDTARLPPGRYRARLVAQGPAAEWTFEITP